MNRWHRIAFHRTVDSLHSRSTRQIQSVALFAKAISRACFAPSIVWLARAVKVVFWRTAKRQEALRRGPPEPPPLTALAAPEFGRLGSHARNLLCSERTFD